MYKVMHKLSPKPILDLFKMKSRGTNDFVVPKVVTINRGIETMRFRGPKTWEIVPEDIKNAQSLSIFKEKIKNWTATECTCRLCMEYIQGVGYGVFKGDIFYPRP